MQDRAADSASRQEVDRKRQLIERKRQILDSKIAELQAEFEDECREAEMFIEDLKTGAKSLLADRDEIASDYGNSFDGKTRNGGAS